MKRRVVLLLMALFIRLLMGGWVTASCRADQQIKVAGKISGVDQIGTKQVIRLQQFRVEMTDKTKYFRGQRVAVIGKCNRRLIDFFLNRIWFMEGEIQVSDKKELAKTNSWWSGEAMRDKLVAVYQRWLPEPEASLLAGIVLGVKQDLPQKFYDALINTGTIHIVVASGYNLTVVAEMIFYLLIYLVKRKWASVGVVAGMMGYAWLTGWEVPIMRALIMASLVLWSKVSGRMGQVGWWLMLTVWAMLMWQPDLMESISFQLSVAATGGLVWIEPKIRKMITNVHQWPINTNGKWIQRTVNLLTSTELIPTLSAQIATAPLIWWHFGRLSLISPLVNLMVLPLVPPAMLLGVLMLGVGGIAAPFIYSILHLMVVIINFFG